MLEPPQPPSPGYRPGGSGSLLAAARVEQPPRRPAPWTPAAGARRLRAGQCLGDRVGLALPGHDQPDLLGGVDRREPEADPRGGGLGQSCTANDRALVPRRPGDPGKIEATCPSGPRPSSRTSNRGSPARRRRPRRAAGVPAGGVLGFGEARRPTAASAWTRAARGRRPGRAAPRRAPLLVALVVVGGDEPLVAPPDVDRRPVDHLADRLGGQRGDVLEDRGADPAAGQHHRRGAVDGLGGGQPGDQRGGDGPGQPVGVRLDDDVRRLGRASPAVTSRRPSARLLGRRPCGSAFGCAGRRVASAGAWPLASAGSNQMCSRVGERSASPVTPVAASSASR